MTAPSCSPERRAIVRLDRCPQCNYDLLGLARSHNCPECGLDYDENAFVLEGHLPQGNYWDSQVTAIFFLWALIIGVGIGRRIGLGTFLVFMLLSYVVIVAAARGLQRLRSRPGQALLLWVNGEGVAVQPAFRWSKRRPWPQFGCVDARPARTFLMRPHRKRWRLRLRPPWPRVLYDVGIDVTLACSRREIALVRNTMRRLLREAGKRR